MKYEYKIEKAIGDENKIWVGTSNAQHPINAILNTLDEVFLWIKEVEAGKYD